MSRYPSVPCAHGTTIIVLLFIKKNMCKLTEVFISLFDRQILTQVN